MNSNQEIKINKTHSVSINHKLHINQVTGKKLAKKSASLKMLWKKKTFHARICGSKNMTGMLFFYRNSDNFPYPYLFSQPSHHVRMNQDLI